MDIKLRREEPGDHIAVELLTREAFWDMNLPGRHRCDEHFLVHKMRSSAFFVPELDYVAEYEGKLIGNIMYTKSKIVDAAGAEHIVLTFGPLSVLPRHQKSGVGSALVKRTLAEAGIMGYKAIFIYGHPGYYVRFGFKNAAEYGVTTSDGKNFEAFMGCELYPGALDGITGSLHTDPVYEIDPDEFEAYDSRFPAR